jgi:hypothetical protein
MLARRRIAHEGGTAEGETNLREVLAEAGLMAPPPFRPEDEGSDRRLGRKMGNGGGQLVISHRLVLPNSAATLGSQAGGRGKSPDMHNESSNIRLMFRRDRVSVKVNG